MIKKWHHFSLCREKDHFCASESSFILSNSFETVDTQETCSCCCHVRLPTLTPMIEARFCSTEALNLLTDSSVMAVTRLHILQLPPEGGFYHLFLSCLFHQKLVIENMDILVQMKNNFDKPEEMANLKRRLTGEKWRGERGRGGLKRKGKW